MCKSATITTIEHLGRPSRRFQFEVSGDLGHSIQSTFADTARKARCQVAYGEEVDDEILVAAFAWIWGLQKLSKRPIGQAHHFRWKVGSQSLCVRNGYHQGGA